MRVPADGLLSGVSDAEDRDFHLAEGDGEAGGENGGGGRGRHSGQIVSGAASDH